jgi:hypothetical protein
LLLFHLIETQVKEQQDSYGAASPFSRNLPALTRNATISGL